MHKDKQELRSFINNTDREEVVDYVHRISRQINQRFYRLEKAGVGTGDTAYRYAQRETGKEIPRFPTHKNTLNQMTNTELYEMSLQIKQKLDSDTSTIRGLEKVYEKRLSESVKELNHSFKESGIVATLDEDEFNEFLKQGGGELMNSKQLSSTQIAEDFAIFSENGGSVKQFLRAYTRYKDISKVDYGRIKKEYANIIARKKRKTKTKKKG